MTIIAPKVERRTATELLRNISDGVPNWVRGSIDAKSGLEAALMQVAARFGELIVNRLNRVPEMNFLAFLDLLGVSPQPMEAACVPLTFYLAPGSVGAMVLEGTKVAAPPPKGDQRPVVFETQRDLSVTSAKLDLLFIKNGQSDQYADLSAAVTEPSEKQAVALPPCAVEVKPNPIPHLLYLGLPVSAIAAGIDRLALKFAVERPAVAGTLPVRVQWEIQVPDENVDASKASPAAQSTAPATKTLVVEPFADGTKNLTDAGDVVFQNVPKIVPTTIDDRNHLWMCCRLMTPLAGSSAPAEQALQESNLAVITDVSAQIEQTRKDLPVDQGFWNATKLDVTKEFYPFGERPKLGDTFYFAQREAFSNLDAEITIQVDVAKTPSSGTEAASAMTSPPQLTWDFWNGSEWETLGVSGRHMRLGEAGAAVVDTEFVDATLSLTKSEGVTFRFSRPPVESSVNGVKNYWIRARITSGDYGKDVQVQQDPGGKPLIIPSTLAPPVVRSISVDYEIKKESAPTAVIACNDWECRPLDRSKSFKPFSALTPEEAPPALYFGFSHDVLPTQPTQPNARIEPASKPNNKFPSGSISLYIALADITSERSEAPRPDRTPASWDYWNGSRWDQLPVPDETQGLRRSGIIRLLIPPDFHMRREFAQRKYWLRMRLAPLAIVPKLLFARLNTVLAVQGSLVTKDVLGSSNGKPHQKFHTTQPMVLPGQKLEVREPTMPPKEERACIIRDEGSDAIQPEVNPATGKRQIWVTWHRVANFYGSTERDRHYVLDRVTGEVSFGDGECGMLPPVLDANIRMTRYRSGGGTRGNLPAHSITQLVSAVPYVQKVTNWMASNGGTEPETDTSLRERGPHLVRHRDRAVTVEDFEDLAMLASREVARAKCVPLYDLKSDPDARRRKPGRISLILVPNSSDPKPMPGTDLFDRVLNFLDTRRMPTNELVLVGPEYVRVDVSAEVIVSQPEIASQVELDIADALKRYLHPVTGGPRGTGWDYGRFPQRFDLCVLMEKIPEVNYVRNLHIHLVPQRPGAERTGRSLICNGEHAITTRLEEYAADLAQSR